MKNRIGARVIAETSKVLPAGFLLGLARHERLDQAEVLRPDGKETLTNLAADRFYAVREGHGVVSSKLPEHRVKLP